MNQQNFRDASLMKRESYQVTCETSPIGTRTVGFGDDLERAEKYLRWAGSRFRETRLEKVVVTEMTHYETQVLAVNT